MSEEIQSVSPLSPFTSISTLTPKYLLDNYLRGIKITDDCDKPYPDSFYWTHIRAAVAEFERVTKVVLLRRTITDEPHDYDVRDYNQYCFLRLWQYPLVSVTKIKAVYPTGQTIIEFPAEWYRVNPESGQVQLVPTQGTLSQVILGRGGDYLPILYGNVGYLPQLFRCDYVAGFEDGKMPWDILDALAKMAAINVYAVVAQAVIPLGVGSVSTGTDGLSQSVSYVNNGQLPPAFTGIINMYRGDLYGNPRNATKGILKEIQEHHRGIPLTIC